MKINVLCRPGSQQEELPCAFHLGGRRLPVVMVLACWLDLPHKYFEVTVGDGRRFVLRQDVVLRTWELAAVFAASKPRPRPLPPQDGARSATSAWWRFGR